MQLHTPGLSRLLASMLYEGLVVFAILLIFFWLPQSVIAGNFGVPSAKLLWLHVLLVLGAYFVWFWLKSGQTLPMKTWRLKLVSSEGSPVRPLQAVLRYLAAWPSILFFGIGLLWAFIDKEHRFLHDRIASTRIVRVEN